MQPLKYFGDNLLCISLNQGKVLTTFKAEIAAKKGAPVYLTRKI